ncbi:MAG: phosphoribosylanthranilate isomerase [Candidatus Hydrothermarchaeales archaeon]
MVKVKICGITSKEDAANCLRLGADAIGTVVDVPVDTPRKITTTKAGDIHSSLPFLTPGVAVIMPKSVEETVEMVLKIRPYAVQLHGNESIEFLKELKDRLQIKIIKTVHVKDEKAFKAAYEYSKYCDAILLDTATSKLGGSGLKHDWGISKKIVGNIKKPVILAGGLRPENVKEAVREVMPYGVDVSSGVESEAGRKDYDMVKRFIDNAKGALR